MGLNAPLTGTDINNISVRGKSSRDSSTSVQRMAKVARTSISSVGCRSEKRRRTIGERFTRLDDPKQLHLAAMNSVSYSILSHEVGRIRTNGNPWRWEIPDSIAG